MMMMVLLLLVRWRQMLTRRASRVGCLLKWNHFPAAVAAAATLWLLLLLLLL